MRYGQRREFPRRCQRLWDRVDDGKPLTDAAAIQSCFECHKAIEDRDYVFTRYAP